jgi:hypothetical protein
VSLRAPSPRTTVAVCLALGALGCGGCGSGDRTPTGPPKGIKVSEKLRRFTAGEPCTLLGNTQYMNDSALRCLDHRLVPMSSSGPGPAGPASG